MVTAEQSVQGVGVKRGCCGGGEGLSCTRQIPTNVGVVPPPICIKAGSEINDSTCTVLSQIT